MKTVPSPKSVPSESSGIYIGAPTKNVELVGELVLEILDRSAGDSVKIAAVQAVTAVLSVNNTTIHDCNFTVGKK